MNTLRNGRAAEGKGIHKNGRTGLKRKSVKSGMHPGGLRLRAAQMPSERGGELWSKVVWECHWPKSE